MKMLASTLLLLWGLCCAEHAAAASSDQRFVQGLVERRLFDLAVLECHNQLSRADLSALAHVDWTVELIRILSQQAANSAPTARAATWQAAHTAAADFLAQAADHPRRLLVQVQDALTSLAAGELARIEAEVAAEPQAAQELARTEIRQATRALEELDKQLTEQVARSSDRTDAADPLSGDELVAVQNHVRFQLARAFRNQALCYAPGSDDRVASLTMAVEQLNRTLRQLRADDPLVWQVYLDLATCQRLLGSVPQAQLALTAPLSDKAPADIQLRALAETAELAVAAGNPQQALDELKQARAAQNVSSAEVDFAQLEATLALWKMAVDQKNDETAAQWQKQATAAVTALEQLHGPYWGRRGELELLRVAGTGSAVSSVEILGRTADNLYLKKQFDEAVLTYERAAQQARTAGDNKAAFTWESKAAAIEQQLKRYQRAAQRLERLALEQKTEPQAAETHLLAAWNEAQALRAETMDTQRYTALLEQHLTLWPDSPTSNVAREWLGKLRESESRWEAAVDAYRGIQPDAEQFSTNLPALTRCWERWIDQQPAASQEAAKMATDAARYFDDLILDPNQHSPNQHSPNQHSPEQRWPERWTDAQRAAALASARLRLAYLHDGYVDAERALTAALQSTQDVDDAWRATAQSLLVLAIAGQPGRIDEANKLLEQLGTGSPDRLLEVVDGLSTLVKRAPPQLRSQLAQLQLTALEHLQNGNVRLDDTQRVRIDQVRAESLLAAGRNQDALQVYQQLAASQPDNGQVQIDYAQLLLESDDPATLSLAVTQWQKVLRRLRPGSDDWFRAKYSFALTLFQRNQQQDRATAGQQLRYLKATSSVDQSPWKTKVDELLQRCPP
ncbi:MAG: tetratricopeptide repeat protein [Pirellulaceae bacterium]